MASIQRHDFKDLEIRFSQGPTSSQPAIAPLLLTPTEPSYLHLQFSFSAVQPGISKPRAVECCRVLARLLSSTRYLHCLKCRSCKSGNLGCFCLHTLRYPQTTVPQRTSPSKFSVSINDRIILLTRNCTFPCSRPTSAPTAGSFSLLAVCFPSCPHLRISPHS